ncbi:DHA2 family efflux MFS transporter permease subunit [Alicyclobacillus tolerans]|uniref:DHA2 family efflux MFS transporter permease subunit n=1 Tax=Alicyclobacillus tolerans TaxID=90970 RepID=UPI001EFF6749|nr:DHA2 family efflux MFS transporter permease subunit [Alicyclobacillus tolerans]MCF8563457.1 DHA2 family efflux MFS transporter permease subunit [Alicyclobacillus tolerans]
MSNEIVAEQRHNISSPAVGAYWQLLIVLIGAFMDLLDTTVVNVGIPDIESSLGASTDQIQWVITAYLLTLGVLIPLTSWLIDRFGAKNLFVFSVFVFSIGSALCGFSWNLASMISFRVLQAVGGGFMMPVVISILYRLFPANQRNLPMGIFGLVIAAAPAFGPLLGGYLVAIESWRLIFFINVPVGLAATFLSLWLLSPFDHAVKSKLDIWGFVWSTIGFFCLLYAFSEVYSYGWSSPIVKVPLIIGCTSLLFMVWIELNNNQPLIELRVLTDTPYLLSLIIVGVIYVALFIGIFILPLYLQNVRNYSVMQVGEFMTPGAVGAAVAMLLSGAVQSKVGTRTFALPGLLMLAIADYLLSGLQVDTPARTLQTLFVIRSIGMGFTIMPIMKVGLDRVPEFLSDQSIAISNMSRQVVSSLGMAVLASYMLTRARYHYAKLRWTVTPGSPYGLQFLQYQTHFEQLGYSASMAHLFAVQTLYNALQSRTFTMGVDDTFFVDALLAIVVAVLTMFFSTTSVFSYNPRRHITHSEGEILNG